MNWVLVVVAALFVLVEAGVVERKGDELSEYEDIPDRPYPGSVHVMPIVQRDTKNQVNNKIEEIIRELPTDDDSLERIGKMLNDSYEKIGRDAKEGNYAIHSKLTNFSPMDFTILPIFSSYLIRIIYQFVI